LDPGQEWKDKKEREEKGREEKGTLLLQIVAILTGNKAVLNIEYGAKTGLEFSRRVTVNYLL